MKKSERVSLVRYCVGLVIAALNRTGGFFLSIRRDKQQDLLSIEIMHLPLLSNSAVIRGSTWRRSWLLCCLMAVWAIPVFGVERVVTISAPEKVAAGAEVTVSVLARTDAGAGEKIGFFHAEYSKDGGATWTGFCYEENPGTTVTRLAHFKAGAAGSKVLVRVRIAFRGGKAGDVDFNGAPLKWNDTWEKWKGPPAKFSTTVVAP